MKRTLTAGLLYALSSLPASACDRVLDFTGSWIAPSPAYQRAIESRFGNLDIALEDGWRLAYDFDKDGTHELTDIVEPRDGVLRSRFDGNARITITSPATVCVDEIMTYNTEQDAIRLLEKHLLNFWDIRDVGDEGPMGLIPQRGDYARVQQSTDTYHATAQNGTLYQHSEHGFSIAAPNHAGSPLCSTFTRDGKGFVFHTYTRNPKTGKVAIQDIRSPKLEELAEYLHEEAQ